MVTGNSSGLIETVRQIMDFVTTTAGAAYTAKITTKNVANGIACSYYICLALDYFGSCCDATTIVIAFFPKTRVPNVVFADCTVGSKFPQTLQDGSKKAGVILGYK